MNNEEDQSGFILDFDDIEEIYTTHFEEVRTDVLADAINSATDQKNQLISHIAQETCELITDTDIDRIHLDKLNTIIDIALVELLDRVQFGDKVPNRLSVDECMRVPVKAKVLNDIVKTLFDRHDVSRARIKVGRSATASNMNELIAALKGSGREATIIDAELLDRGDGDGEG